MPEQSTCAYPSLDPIRGAIVTPAAHNGDAEAAASWNAGQSLGGLHGPTRLTAYLPNWGSNATH